MGDNMLGEYKLINYNSKKVKTFIPYSLNELYITAKKSTVVATLENELTQMLPITNPLNTFFYELLMDTEMLDSLNLSGNNYILADLYSPFDYDLFTTEIKQIKAIFQDEAACFNKIGYSNLFIKGLHKRLFQQHKPYYPGAFRKNISFLGKSFNDANFISAEVKYMENNMDEMELFMHREDISVFQKSALLYYQIMTNLPFAIGNDLIARLVSQLYLIEYSNIKHFLLLSRFLNDIEHVRLEAIKKGDINIFLEAFLTAIKNAIKKIDDIIKGYNKLKLFQEKKIAQSYHTIYQKRRLNEMLHQSHKTVYLLSEPLQKRFSVLNKTIKKRYHFLVELGILKTEKTYFLTRYFNQRLLRLLTK